LLSGKYQETTNMRAVSTEIGLNQQINCEIQISRVEVRSKFELITKEFSIRLK